MASFFAPAPRSRPGPDHDPPLVARRPTLRNPCRSSEPFRPPYGKSVATATRAEPTSSFRLALAKRLPTSRQRFSGSERPRRLTGLEPRRTCATTGPPPCLARHVCRESSTRSRAEQHQHQNQPEVLRLEVSASCCDGHGPSRNASLRRFNPTDRPSVAYEQGLRPARSYGYTVSDVTTVVLRIAATPAARRYDGNYIDAPFPRRAPLVASRTSAPLRSRRSYSSTSFGRDVPPPPLSATTFTRSLREASPLKLAVRPGSRSAPVAAHGSPVSRLRSSGFGYVVA